MLVFGFEEKNSHASHTLLNNNKKKSLLAILFAFLLHFFFAAHHQQSVPQLTTRLKICPKGWTLLLQRTCGRSYPGSLEMPKSTKYHFVHLLTVFAQSVNIFAIFNANCLHIILLLLAVLLPPRGSAPPHGKDLLYFQTMTRDRIQMPSHVGRVALFPFICSCTISTPKKSLVRRVGRRLFLYKLD